jgi:hypothetical protein
MFIDKSLDLGSAWLVIGLLFMVESVELGDVYSCKYFMTTGVSLCLFLLPWGGLG